MKAAVVHEIGGVPRYEDFPDADAREGEVLVDVRAVAVENLDREIVAGRHFSAGSFTGVLPAIPCFDGVGTLLDGTLVGFGGAKPPYGALAERVVVPKAYVSPAPEGIDPAVAVVLSSAVTGFAIRSAAGFKPGESVLIQGATGVAGRLAVQVARKLGANRIVATGRQQAALDEVAELGADATIDTAVSDEELVAAFASEAGDGYDVILDFLGAGLPSCSCGRSLRARCGSPSRSGWSKSAQAQGSRSRFPRRVCGPQVSSCTGPPKVSPRSSWRTHTSRSSTGLAPENSSSASSARHSARSNPPGRAPTYPVNASSSCPIDEFFSKSNDTPIHRSWHHVIGSGES